MAGEIRIVQETGLTLTAYAYYDNAGTMTLRGSSAMTEEPASSGIYKNSATISGLAFGDVIKVLDSAGDIRGSDEYNTDLFKKAAKLLVNKAVQNKNTGAIDYYDNDGQTILFTHTPVDDESTITRTPG